MALQGTSFDDEPPPLVRVLAGNAVTGAVVFACINTTDATVLRRLHPAVGAAVAEVPWFTTATAVRDTARWRAALPAAVGLKLASKAVDARAFMAPSGVVALDLYCCRDAVTNAVIAHLPATLRSLNVSSAYHLTAHCSFAHLPVLGALQCSHTNVAAAGLDRLPPSLRELRMCWCSLPATADFSHLRALRVVICANLQSPISAATISSLPPSLEVLDIGEGMAADYHYGSPKWSFAHLTCLRDLRATRSRIDAAALATLPPSLCVLNLQGSRALKPASSLAHLPHLHTLDASDTSLCDATLATLPPSLVTLKLHGFHESRSLTPAAVFPHLPALRVLNVSRTAIGDAAVASMPPDLEELHMTGCVNVTQYATLDHLTALQVLYSVGTDLSPATVAACRARGCVAPADGIVYKCPDVVSALVQLADGRLVSGTCGGHVALWAAAAHGRDAVAEAQVGAVDVRLAVLPDGHRVAIGSWRWQVMHSGIAVWDTSTAPTGGIHRPAFEFACSSKLLALAALRDGHLVAGFTDGCLRIVDVDVRAVLAELAGHTEGVTALVVLPDGMVASASNDRAVRLWDTGTRTCTTTLEGHTSAIASLAVLPDGRLASGSRDGTVWLWDVGARVCIRVLNGCRSAIAALAALPGGWLACASDEGTIVVWDTRHVGVGVTVTPLPLVTIEVAMTPTTLLPLPGGRLATAGTTGVRLWQLPSPPDTGAGTSWT